MIGKLRFIKLKHSFKKNLNPWLTGGNEPQKKMGTILATEKNGNTVRKVTLCRACMVLSYTKSSTQSEIIKYAKWPKYDQ